MNKNIGLADRIARVIIGIVLIAYAIPLGFPVTNWNWFGWIGVIPLITGLVGTCPVYSLLGFTTHSHQ